MHSSSILASLPLLALVRAAPAAQCAVSFEGRIPKTYNLADWDSEKTNPFRTDATLGQGLKWSQIISYPVIDGSQYDVWGNSKPFEVTLSDKSIYTPSPSSAQPGLRRAELQPAAGRTDASKALFTGKKTVHFSLQFDAARPLNYSHEYQPFFIETADWITNQLILRVGAPLDGTTAQKQQPKTLRLYGNSKSNQVLFETAFVDGWNNFALELDFDKNTVKTYYSQGSNTLKAVTSAVSNDLSGNGEFHFGLLKKPTGTSDILTSGFQEKNINEGLIYGGIFIENGQLDCSRTSGVGKRLTESEKFSNAMELKKRQVSITQGTSTIGWFPASHDANKPINWDKGPLQDDCGPAKGRWRGASTSGSSIIWSQKRSEREAEAYRKYYKRSEF